MAKTIRINAIIVDVNIRPNAKLAVRIDYSVFGDYKKRSRYYTFEDAQRFIIKSKLYDFNLLIGHGIWVAPTYTYQKNGQLRGIDALYCGYIDIYHNMEIHFKDGSIYDSRLTLMEANDLFWRLNEEYEKALIDHIEEIAYDAEDRQSIRDYNNSSESDYLSRYKGSFYDMDDDWDYEEFPPENIW